MNALRWTLAVVVVLAGIGFGIFFVLANNFRRSFGASENNLLIGIIPVLLALVIAWWLVRTPHPPVTTATLTYPVLLVNEDKIAEVCLSAEELTLRPENQDHVIEQKFHIVDAAGGRFRIANYRTAEPRPSSLNRVFNATFYSVKSFKVAFDLRPDGTLSREAVLAQLRDREWTLPAAAATLPFAELFIAYRADRYREYGTARDRMPVAAPKEKSNL